LSPASIRRLHSLFLAVWILQLIAVIIGSLLPGGMVPSPIGAHDKLAHFGGYLLLGFLPLAGARSVKWGIVLALCAIPMGVALELGQHFVPGRTPDVLDALANSAGVLAGMAAAGAYRILFLR
jgi:VanZ family protein